MKNKKDIVVELYNKDEDTYTTVAHCEKEHDARVIMGALQNLIDKDLIVDRAHGNEPFDSVQIVNYMCTEMK